MGNRIISTAQRGRKPPERLQKMNKQMADQLKQRMSEKGITLVSMDDIQTKAAETRNRSLTSTNAILAFLQYISNADDARTFYRIAIDSLSSGAEAACEEFDKKAIFGIVSRIDNRI